MRKMGRKAKSVISRTKNLFGSCKKTVQSADFSDPEDGSEMSASLASLLPEGTTQSIANGIYSSHIHSTFHN
jgi:hypothetical protein